ncbi:hypothetical protein OG765_15075 [Streptomyces sp. NBC_00555]|uniref:hypothetical protein n=1 Tax=Streptomyces sp. NBC_00555 TaxID=2903662 RepID=UPI00224D8CCA|nr:hypothetical protein [Streptomyces sp. NBC_00555]MCX5012312.1 hypothetical protein [Streptomyces sp. NBC_00555]
MGKNEDDRAGISDEEWARFMEQAAEGSGDAPKEPSARARMVTERLREERSRGQEPPGWRTGPARQEMQGRGRRKRRLKAFAAIVLVAGLALIAVRPELVIDRITGKTEARQQAKNAAPLPAESGRPTAPPAAVDPDQPTLQEPFRGSPALQWADGAAGIEVPEATAVGGMSKQQVADALEKTRQFLIAANLDPATLRGERPAAALAILDPRQPEVPQRLEQSLTKPTAENTPVLLFTRFDQAKVKPVGDVVKVRGSMRAEQGEPGELLVVTDYTFVHPMTNGGTSVQRTIVRRQITLSLLDPARWAATGDRLQLRKYVSEWSNVGCETADGFLHPDFPRAAPAGSAPTGPAVDPYDRSRDIEGEGCGTVTRS